MGTKKVAANAPTGEWAPKQPALMMRTCDAQMRAHGGFRWPTKGLVEAPDWKPIVACVSSAARVAADAWAKRDWRVAA